MNVQSVKDILAKARATSTDNVMTIGLKMKVVDRNSTGEDTGKDTGKFTTITVQPNAVDVEAAVSSTGTRLRIQQ